MIIQYLFCISILLLGCLAVYFHHGGGVAGVISVVFLLFMIASLSGAIFIGDYLKDNKVKKEFISLNENIINNKPNLNEGLKFIEDPPYLSQINSKQTSVDLQSVNISTCNAIKNNLLSNINPKYTIKEVVINNNNKSLCKSGDANRIQYILEIN